MSGHEYLLRELGTKNELIARLIDENVALDNAARAANAELERVEAVLTDAQKRKLEQAD